MAIRISKDEKVLGVFPAPRFRAVCEAEDGGKQKTLPVLAVVVLHDTERNTIRADVLTEIGLHIRSDLPESVVLDRRTRQHMTRQRSKHPMKANIQDTGISPSPSLEDRYWLVDDLINRLGGMIEEARGIAMLLSRDAGLDGLDASPDGGHVLPATRGLATLLGVAERQHDECAAAWRGFVGDVNRRVPSPPLSEGGTSGLTAQRDGGWDDVPF